MPTVDCLIVQAGRLLMIRRPETQARPGMLLPIGGPVGHGESPLEACLREALEATGLHVSPSCVAVISSLTLAQRLDYRLTFVAEAPAHETPFASAEGELEWVDLSELSRRTDIPELDRGLIPRLLASNHPVSVVLEVDTSTEPYTRRVVEVAAMDLARLSPLVFAVID